MKPFLCLAVFFFAFAANALPDTLPTVPGEVLDITDDQRSMALFAELVDAGRVVHQSNVINGTFEFRQVRMGSYELRITDGRGDPVARKTVSLLGPVNAPLSIDLPRLRKVEPVSGVVSVARLQHRPPRKAAGEFAKAVRASERQDHKRALQHLKKALSLYPDYAEAHNNIGSCFMRLGQFQEAETHFRAAIALDPESSFVHANLAAALLSGQRLPEAESAARRALELDPRAPKNHYILALALRALGKPPLEIVKHFRRAAGAVPKAYVAAAQLLASMGAFDDARKELRSYLETGPPDRAKVEGWMAELPR